MTCKREAEQRMLRDLVQMLTVKTTTVRAHDDENSRVIYYVFELSNGEVIELVLMATAHTARHCMASLWMEG